MGIEWATCLLFCPGTEFVVVEDSSCLDTNAIILKGTTVLTYKPRLLDRPFSGSLAGIEVNPLACNSSYNNSARLYIAGNMFCFNI